MSVTNGCIYSNGSVLGTTKVKSYNRFAALSNGVYTIDAELAGNTYIEDGDPFFVVINATGSSNVLVSGIDGRIIEVNNYNITASGASDITFLSGSTSISGPMILSASGSISADGVSFVTARGESLSLDVSGSRVTGHLTYKMV